MVEFAIIMPLLLLLLLGTIEFGLNLYMRAVLEGVMQQAGRNSGLQTAQAGQDAIDAIVTSRVRAILPNAEVDFVRKNYSEFSGVGRPEDFEDTNANGITTVANVSAISTAMACGMPTLAAPASGEPTMWSNIPPRFPIPA